MKRIIVWLLAAVVCILPNIAIAKNVTVTGLGVTAAEAENDALRNAVENTMGVLVDSETLVQNYAVLSDQIYTKSRGFVTNYAVRSKQQTGQGWQVTIDAEVDDSPNSKLMTELTRLGIIDNALRNPKIAVYIPERHIQYRVPDPAGETAVVKAFVEAGFTNMIEAGGRLSSSGTARSWQSGSYANLHAEDWQDAADFFGADIVIMGEAFSEGVGDAAQFLPGNQRSGMQSCRARVEAKMYIAKTRQIIAADGTYGAGMDISQAVASKKALAAAGRLMGEYLVGEALKLGSGNRQGMQLVVIGMDFTKINLVKEALGRIRGVKNVQLSNYEGGKGIFTMHYSGAPQTLFHELQSATTVDLKMESASYNTLTVRAY